MKSIITYQEMGKNKPLLGELVKKGKPLAEVVVTPANDENLQEIADLLDDLSPDISADVIPEYFQISGADPTYEIRFEATKEALLREFGWKIWRKNLPKWNQETNSYDGVYEDAFYWHEDNQPQYYPDLLQGKILAMGLTQPGASDEGNDDNISYDSNKP